MHLALQLVRGFITGVAGLLPGLSGSTLLVLFHLYRPLTAALAHPLRDLRGHWRQFGPFLLAAGAGVLIGSRLLAALYARHETAALYLFMGFMAGVLPDLFRHTRRTKGHPAGWLAFAALFGLCLALTRLQDRLPPGPAALSGHWSIWLLAGAGIGLGSIVPGASATFLLIYFGVYQPLLEGVARLNLPVLLPAVLGAGAAILLFARFADWLFRVAEGAATRGVLGLVAGSLWLVFPGWPHGVSAWLCGSLFVLGAGISAALNQLAPPPAEGNPS